MHESDYDRSPVGYIRPKPNKIQSYRHIVSVQKIIFITIRNQ